MATIRKSGSGWQALIRRKNYVGPRSKTFPSEYLARCWAEAVEESAADKNDSNPDESTEINHGF